MEAPPNSREKLIGLSRGYTMANAIYLVPITFAVLTVLAISLLSRGFSETMNSIQPTVSRTLWLILLTGSWYASWAHRDCRDALMDGGSLPAGSSRLWFCSALLNLCAIGLYLWQMTDIGPHGLRLRYWELHLLVCVLPCYALFVATCGFCLCVRIRTKPLHNRCRLLS